MKALRLKLFQETACYKKPHAFKVAESYPLPPFSTVKGMLHALLNAKSFIPMKLCIQGNYDTIISDYQTHYFFKKNHTNEFALTTDGLAVSRDYSDITTMPIYMHMLYHVQLVIYVQAEEQVLYDLKEAFYSTDNHISLGRHEDLVRVDECEIVHLEEPEDDVDLTLNAYVPKSFIHSGDSYMPLRLNWTYRIIQNVRVWDKLEVGYMQSGTTIEADQENLYVDDEGRVVFFHD
ncbi:type I-B CRISPR-associated protein Cas5b [Bacillus solimangrovi]|uniref:Type I-B CRISPR-associated protein Cas5 n=1 Tax=Bacillus solimangrovi TaxID=1305675 RepID=A0A1E5LG21_9BACI|nr:type I-B CRISPR-associated protein Cas5b [Bacillus solimangrovi]OEH93022.1 type I-B CRISPR-associated protein Cas5 [Bacillus solimangrovi]